MAKKTRRKAASSGVKKTSTPKRANKGATPTKGRFATARAVVVRAIALLAVVLVGYSAWLDLKVQQRLSGKLWQVPARIYARPLELYDGLLITAHDLEHELVAAGYKKVDGAADMQRPGSFHTSANRFVVHARSFLFWDGREPERRLEFELVDQRVFALKVGGEAFPIARLEPALIGRIYPQHNEDRILVRLNETPEALTAGLIAVEDRGFYEHFGISLRGITRALIANLRAGAVVQGGSTLTQQLAKNLFLTEDRTVWRKVNDALMAFMLEAHFDKAQILEAYLNEIFLGQQGGRAIHGFGLAARYYFGRPLEELEHAEIALLITIARGAPYYNPRKHPERVLKRRNFVLATMAERDVITTEQAQAAQAAPLGVLQHTPRGQTSHPAFVDLVRLQLNRDYREEDLRNEGLRIFTTLAPSVQQHAEESLSTRLDNLETSKKLEAGALQGAVTVTDTQSAEVLALVGGRDSGVAGFNRAINARRAVGSLIKPVVYLAALEQADRYTLVSELDDVPVNIESPPGQLWSPNNYDGNVHGLVPLYAALANSYNLATVNLGLRIGLEKIAGKLRLLGAERDAQAYPSMLLGAVELSPLEITQVYHTIANGGFKTPLRAVREVTDGEGQPLSRYGLDVTQAADPGPVFLTTHALQEALRSGTGRSVATRLPGNLQLAGKTGTTNALRDSWFAGFGGRLLSVVWVGKDDNTSTGLTGASGALQAWIDLMAKVQPGALSPVPPPDIEWHWTDTRGRFRTDENCPDAYRFPFIEGSAPPYVRCGQEQTLRAPERAQHRSRLYDGDSRTKAHASAPQPTGVPSGVSPLGEVSRLAQSID